jgi:hypothetical protein
VPVGLFFDVSGFFAGFYMYYTPLRSQNGHIFDIEKSFLKSSAGKSLALRFTPGYNYKQKRGAELRTITLYHGSSYDFDVINLQKCRPYKDFGQGFYISADVVHAKSMAERNAEMQKSKSRRFDSEYTNIEKWLYRYRFDVDKATELTVKEFIKADREWGRFITLNRSSRGVPHKYDIVIGPTANDYTNPTIQFYMSGGVGEVGSDVAINELIRLLLPYKLPFQYFFATERAVDCLTLIQKEKI